MDTLDRYQKAQLAFSSEANKGNGANPSKVKKLSKELDAVEKEFNDKQRQASELIDRRVYKGQEYVKNELSKSYDDYTMKLIDASNDIELNDFPDVNYLMDVFGDDKRVKGLYS